MFQLWPEQRAKRGTASQFPAQKGYGDPLFPELISVETAVKQPALSSLLRPQPSGMEWHKNVYQIQMLLVNSPLCKAGLSCRLCLLCVSVRDRSLVLPGHSALRIQHLPPKRHCMQHVSAGDYPLTYFCLGLLGLSGMVILKRPLFTSGMRILALKCSRWAMPIKA